MNVDVDKCVSTIVLCQTESLSLVINRCHFIYLLISNTSINYLVIYIMPIIYNMLCAEIISIEVNCKIKTTKISI